MTKKETKMLKQILRNQKDIMIWIHGMNAKKSYYEGYFKYRIEETEELIE